MGLIAPNSCQGKGRRRGDMSEDLSGQDVGLLCISYFWAVGLSRNTPTAM
jgi:hypothetical protein